MNILDRVLGVMTDPARTFQDISREKPTGWGFTVLLGQPLLCYGFPALIWMKQALSPRVAAGFIFGGLIVFTLYKWL